jgi:hypothetical protein
MSIATVRPTPQWIVPAIAVLALVLALAALALEVNQRATVRSLGQAQSTAAVATVTAPAVAKRLSAEQLLQARWHDALSQPRAVLYRHFGLAQR